MIKISIVINVPTVLPNKMKLSIVIPIYNSSSYICDALDSVVEEAKGRELEIILIDDKSTDIASIRNIAKRYPAVILVEKKEKTNAADSRNIGIGRSTGDYIFLLDSDDKFQPGVFERRINIHNNKGSGVVFGSYTVQRGSVQRNITLPFYGGEDVRDYLMVRGGDFRTSTVSLCRCYYKGTKFDPESKKHQDWIFGIRAYDKNEAISFDDAPSSRIAGDRIGRMSSSFNLSASRYFFDKYLKTTVQKNGFSEKNWKFMIESRDKEYRDFVLSLYTPIGVTLSAKFCFIRFVSRPSISKVVSPLIMYIRRVKYFF